MTLRMPFGLVRSATKRTRVVQLARRGALTQRLVGATSGH
jgi:hypothetical protein